MNFQAVGSVYLAAGGTAEKAHGPQSSQCNKGRDTLLREEEENLCRRAVTVFLLGGRAHFLVYAIIVLLKLRACVFLILVQTAL